MFRFIKELLSPDSLLRQAFEATAEMLREDLTMFEESVQSLRRASTGEVKFDIYAADKKINKFEREVRRKVLTHLAIAQPADAGPALVLTSVVIDVERIGDYTKNITELARVHPKPLRGYTYEEKLSQVESIITERFRKVTEAYAHSDTELAHRVMREHRDISGWCDQVIAEIIADPPGDIEVGDAVVLAMYIRYLKRISAHLTNIVSSVVNPFPRIGFRSKDQR